MHDRYLEHGREKQYIYPAYDMEGSLDIMDEKYVKFKGNASAPIGVFDSGAGGLTILATLQKELPDESYLYFGDTAYCPYGKRSDAEIIELSVRANRFLLERGAKLLVIACNTASQAALNSLRATFSLPIIGVVPAVKPAARTTRKGRIGIAATNQAAKAAYLHQLIGEFAGNISVYAVGCPELVTLVELGILDGKEVEDTVRQALQPVLREDIDVLVLGCTHFPALRPVIERVVGPHIQVIDSGTAIARRTHAVLDTEGLCHGPSSESTNEKKLHIYCSGDAQAFSRVASKVLGYEVVAEYVEL